jgi:hypothetical protein
MIIFPYYILIFRSHSYNHKVESFLEINPWENPYICAMQWQFHRKTSLKYSTAFHNLILERADI